MGDLLVPAEEADLLPNLTTRLPINEYLILSYFGGTAILRQMYQMTPK